MQLICFPIYYAKIFKTLSDQSLSGLTLARITGSSRDKEGQSVAAGWHFAHYGHYLVVAFSSFTRDLRLKGEPGGGGT